MVQRIQNERSFAFLRSSVQYSSAKAVAQAGFLACLFFCSCTFVEKQYRDIQNPVKKAVLSKKKTSDEFLSQGKILFKQGKYKTAQELFKKEELLQNASLSSAQFYTALTLYRMKDFKKSLEKLKEISEEHPEIQLKSLSLQWKILHIQKIKDHREKLYILSQMIRYHSSLDKKQKARSIAGSIIQGLSNSEIQKLQKDDNLSYIYNLLLFKKAQNLVKDKKIWKSSFSIQRAFKLHPSECSNGRKSSTVYSSIEGADASEYKSNWSCTAFDRRS